MSFLPEKFNVIPFKVIEKYKKKYNLKKLEIDIKEVAEDLYYISEGWKEDEKMEIRDFLIAVQNSLSAPIVEYIPNSIEQLIYIETIERLFRLTEMLDKIEKNYQTDFCYGIIQETKEAFINRANKEINYNNVKIDELENAKNELLNDRNPAYLLLSYWNGCLDRKVELTVKYKDLKLEVQTHHFVLLEKLGILQYLQENWEYDTPQNTPENNADLKFRLTDFARVICAISNATLNVGTVKTYNKDLYTYQKPLTASSVKAANKMIQDLNIRPKSK